MASKTYNFTATSGGPIIKITLTVTTSPYGDGTKLFQGSYNNHSLADLCRLKPNGNMPSGDTAYKPNQDMLIFIGSNYNTTGATCPTTNDIWFSITTAGHVSLKFLDKTAQTYKYSGAYNDFPKYSPVVRRSTVVDGASTEVMKTEVKIKNGLEIEIQFIANGANVYTLRKDYYPFPEFPLYGEQRPNCTIVLRNSPSHVVQIEPNGTVHEVFGNVADHRFGTMDRAYNTASTYSTDGLFTDYTSVTQSMVGAFYKIDRDSVFSSVTNLIPRTLPIDLRLASDEDVNGTIYFYRRNDVSPFYLEFYELLSNGTFGVIKKLFKFKLLKDLPTVSTWGYFMYGTLKKLNKLQPSIELTVLYTDELRGGESTTLDQLAEKASPELFMPSRAGRPYDLNTWDGYPLILGEISDKSQKVNIAIASYSNYAYYDFSGPIAGRVDRAEVFPQLNRRYDYNHEYSIGLSTYEDPLPLQVPTRSYLAREEPMLLRLLFEKESDYTTAWEDFLRPITYRDDQHKRVFIHDMQRVAPSTGMQYLYRQAQVTLADWFAIDKNSSVYSTFKQRVAQGYGTLVFDTDRGDSGSRYFYVPTKFDDSDIYFDTKKESFSTYVLETSVRKLKVDLIAFKIDLSTRTFNHDPSAPAYSYTIVSMDDSSTANKGLDAGMLIKTIKSVYFGNHSGEYLIDYRYAASGPVAYTGEYWMYALTTMSYRGDSDSTFLTNLLIGIVIVIAVVLLGYLLWCLAGFAVVGSGVGLQGGSMYVVTWEFWPNAIGALIYSVVTVGIVAFAGEKDMGVQSIKAVRATRYVTTNKAYLSKVNPEHSDFNNFGY